MTDRKLRPRRFRERTGTIPVFWGIGSFQALAMFRRGLFYAYLSIYLRYYLGLSVTETTLFATLPMLCNIAAQTLVWGRISDRRQIRRTLILWGEFSGAIGTVLIWWVHVLAASPKIAGFAIILGLSAVEIFWSMSNIAWSALISDIYPERKRNAVYGRLTSVGGLGRLAGIWIGGLLYDGLGRKYAGWGFQSGALFFVSAAVMFFSMIPVLYIPEGGVREDYGAASAVTGKSRTDTLRLFLVFMAAITCINFGRNSVMIIQSQYLFLDSGFAVSSRVLSYIFNTESVAIIIFGLVAGYIGRKIGNGRAICLGTFAAVIHLVIFISAGHLWLIYLASFFRGIAEVIIQAASYAMASILIPPKDRGRLFSYFNATLYLSWGVAGTLIAGPIVDLMRTIGATEVAAYKAAYVAGLLLTVIGLLIQLILVYILMPRAGIRKAVTTD